MQTENPKYLNCTYCSSQAVLATTQTQPGFLRYICPAKHSTFVLEEDPSFNYGHNKEEI
jgi:transposase-like protein